MATLVNTLNSQVRYNGYDGELQIDNDLKSINSLGLMESMIFHLTLNIDNFDRNRIERTEFKMLTRMAINQLQAEIQNLKDTNLQLRMKIGTIYTPPTYTVTMI
jgi:hypothetical protein